MDMIKAALGTGIGGTNYGIGLQEPIEAPRTVISALSKLDALNSELRDISQMVEEIAAKVGGPRPVPGNGLNAASAKATDNGLVGHLNNEVCVSHCIASDIRSSLHAINNALG